MPIFPRKDRAAREIRSKVSPTEISHANSSNCIVKRQFKAKIVQEPSENTEACDENSNCEWAIMSHENGSDNQYRPRSDAAEGSICLIRGFTISCEKKMVCMHLEYFLPFLWKGTVFTTSSLLSSTWSYFFKGGLLMSGKNLFCKAGLLSSF